MLLTVKLLYHESSKLKWVLVMVVALDLAASIATVAAPRVDATLDKSAVSARTGRASITRVQEDRWAPYFPYYPRPDGMGHSVASNLVLLEDGVALGPAHAPHEEVQNVGMGAYSHWDRNLIFSSSDGSDPRTNSHTYVMSYVASLDPRLVGGVIWTNVCYLLLWGLSYAGVIWRLVAAKLSRWRSYTVAAIPPAIVSAFLLAYLPPTWNGTDSAIFLRWQLDLFPHYPVLYPQLMDIAVRLFGAGDGAVQSVQLLQHGLLIAGIAYLASSQSQLVPIMVLSVATTIGSALQLYEHGLYTESLALPFLVFGVGAFLRIVDSRRLSPLPLAVYGLALLAAMLARYNFIAFGALLPVYFFLQLLRERNSALVRIRQIAYSAGLCIAVFVLGQGFQLVYANHIGLPSTSTVGRPGAYRMVETGWYLSESDRQLFIQRMQAATDDPAVRFTIERMVLNPQPWLETRNEIQASPLLRLRDVDAVMNSAFIVFLETYEPAALRQMAFEFGGYYFPVANKGMCMSNTGQYSFLLSDSARSIPIFKDSTEIWPYLGTMKSLNSPLLFRYEELLGNPIIQLLDGMSPGILSGLLIALVAAASLWKWCRPDTAYTAVAMAATGVIYAAGSAFITVTLMRYLAPLNLILWVGLGLVVADAIRGQVRRGKVASQAGCTARVVTT